MRASNTNKGLTLLGLMLVSLSVLAEPTVPVTQDVETQSTLSNNNADSVKRFLDFTRQDSLMNRTVAYQPNPRHKHIDSRTQEIRFISYQERLQNKIRTSINQYVSSQIWGTQQINGELIVHTTLKADGTVENVFVSRSPSSKLSDEAIANITKRIAPFEPFPPEISQDTDRLTITSSFIFTVQKLVNVPSNLRSPNGLQIRDAITNIQGKPDAITRPSNLSIEQTRFPTSFKRINN